MTAMLEPLQERLNPSHTILLGIVEAAEALGYRVVAVSTGSVTLYHGDIEITVSGWLVSGSQLRKLLKPVKES